MKKIEKKETLTIARIFDAPTNRVWNAFTVPSEAKKWWGPKNFTAPTAKIDFRVGGKYLYCMRGPGPDGKVQDFWSTGRYKEIIPFKKIVTTDSFSDKNGKIISAEKYGMKGYPLELKITFNFEEKDEKTKFTLIHEGFPKGQGKLARKGWSESFDKLEEGLKKIQKITPCLWFENNAEEAVKFYAAIFKDSKIGRITRYGKEGYEIHKMPEGTVLTIDFEIKGQRFTALNGGPAFKFSEAISFQVYCETQKEIDYYWKKLSKGGDENAKQCGWLKDKFGLSWQIVPSMLDRLFDGSINSERVMKAMLQMKKLDIKKLLKAYKGG